MKILVISNSPLVESQGSGYVIMNTAKSFKSLGHTVDMIPPSETLFISKLDGNGKIYRLALGMGLWVLKNKRKVKQYDLVIFYGAESYFALYIIKKMLRFKMPIVLHSNGIEVHVVDKLKEFEQYLDFNRKWYHLDIGKLFKYTYKQVDAIITVSDYDRDYALNELKLPANKVFTLEPCLPDVYFATNLPDKKQGNIVMYCGTWIIRKGVQSITGSIPQFLREHPDFIFRLIGVGTEFEKSAYFPAEILDRIEVYPLIEDKIELMKMYAETDIFLFPSFSESFGLVVAEAMFCGCCTITGPTGVAANIKNGIEALVLEIPEPTAVNNALELLANSPDLRANMSKAAKQRVKDLKWSSYTQKLEAVLKQIVPQR